MAVDLESYAYSFSHAIIKLEDTLAITDDGYEMFGDRGRGWNRCGA